VQLRGIVRVYPLQNRKSIEVRWLSERERVAWTRDSAGTVCPLHCTGEAGSTVPHCQAISWSRLLLETLHREEFLYPFGCNPQTLGYLRLPARHAETDLAASARCSALICLSCSLYAFKHVRRPRIIARKVFIWRPPVPW
jgi:hypothetical protein